MSEDSEIKPKIIVDDDWKSRARAEKEELQQKRQAEGATSQADSQDVQLPPASFSMLVSTLATQVMAALGRLPNPVDGQLTKHLDLAKHHIDLLAVLEEKTKGNLSQQEQSLLSDVLHELRMDYVAGGYHPPAESQIKDPMAEGPGSPSIVDR